MTRLSKLILIVILCFILTPVYAGRMDYLKGVSSSVEAGESCGAGTPELLFKWVFNSTDVTSGGCVKSGGDSSASPSGEVSVSGGTLTLLDNTNNGADSYEFDSTSETVPQGPFTIEMQVNFTTISDGAALFRIGATGSTDYCRLRFGSGGVLILERTVNSGSDVNKAFASSALSASTTYYLVIRCSGSDGPDLWLSTTKWPDVDSGGSWEEEADTLSTFNSTAIELSIGNYRSYNLEGTYTEYFKVYDGWKTY